MGLTEADGLGLGRRWGLLHDYAKLLNPLLVVRIDLLKWESLLFTLSSLDLDLETWTAARNTRPLTTFSFGLA